MGKFIRPDNMDRLKAWIFHTIPHHMVSRLIFFSTRLHGPTVEPAIQWFIKKFNVDLSDSEISDPAKFSTFNEFFTRALKPEARPIIAGSNTLASPVDGTVSEAGKIDGQSIFQAKGHQYSVQALLGGDAEISRPFENGQFATIYLAPYNYHRIHMPLDARLLKMIHVPGRLFSVAPWTVNSVPGLFARNERVVCLFSTAAGDFAMVLVGAINVAAIETVWSGQVTPPKGKKVTVHEYDHSPKTLLKGAEMGRFNMGSTVILLSAGNVEWLQKIRHGQIVKMGELIGHFPVSPQSPKN